MSFESEYFMSAEEEREVIMPSIVGVTDLGANNTGRISAADLTEEQKQLHIADLARPEYHLPSSKTSICVDQRTDVESGVINPEEHEADWQIAGSWAITGIATDLMVVKDQKLPISKLAEKNMREITAAGYEVIMHGDQRKGKAGCGANGLLCDGSVMRANAENADIVAPIVWTATKALGLDAWVKEDDILTFIVNGKDNVNNPLILDVSPIQLTDIMIKSGAWYEEYFGEHHEMAAVLKINDGAFAKKRFMLDHLRTDGGHNSAFGAALAEYKKAEFDKVRQHGGTDLEAAQHVVAGLLFNIGALKGLTAEETGLGETLPVVLIA